ncbi:MAG: hypothetical protein ACRELY_02080 [Polyangiaceae bacterium]
MRAARKIAFALIGATIFGALVAVVPELSPYSPEEIAYAQTRKKKKPKHEPSTASTGILFDASAPLSSRSEEGPPPGAHEREKKDAGNNQGEVLESRTRGGDGGTRVFRFGEIDIEGRLRTPQLVYFLRRVRAEFAAGDLGHRSFMRELSDTRHDPNF